MEAWILFMISILSFCRSNNLSFSLLVRIKKINIIIRKINNTVITLSKISNLYLENRLGSSLIIVASWGNDNLLISKALIFEASNIYPLGMICGWISLGVFDFQGRGRVTLSDKDQKHDSIDKHDSPQVIIADAMKWVKVQQ